MTNETTTRRGLFGRLVMLLSAALAAVLAPLSAKGFVLPWKQAPDVSGVTDPFRTWADDRQLKALDGLQLSYEIRPVGDPDRNWIEHRLIATDRKSGAIVREAKVIEHLERNDTPRIARLLLDRLFHGPFRV